jgi:hypothetical protein
LSDRLGGSDFRTVTGWFWLSIQLVDATQA